MESNNPVFSRRLFLSRGAQLLSASATLPLFLDRSGRVMAADFAANPAGAGRPDRVLVIVQLAGGNDGLNTVVPVTNDDYYKARPRLGIAKKDALRLTDDFGLHPMCKGFKEMWDAGRMSILHAVGYPNHNRSHFRSTDIWQTAEPDRVGHTGWLGRYFDACCSGEDPGAAPADKAVAAPPSASVALLDEPPMALQGGKYLPIAFRSPDRLQLRRAQGDQGIREAFEILNDDANIDDGGAEMEAMADDEHRPMPQGAQPKSKIRLPYGTNGSLASDVDTDAFVQRSALNARVYADNIRGSVSKVKNQAAYPQQFKLAQDLKLVAQMIASGLPTRVYYVSLGGFDTHSNQLGRHDRLMEHLSSSLTAFVKDLELLGHLDRTCVMTFSEFGRRVSENGSAGTDHGEAAPLFVMGGDKVIKPALVGEFPSLAPDKLSRGDVPFKMDFRRLYATMLDTWLGADHTKVLGQQYEKLELFQKLA